MSSPPMRSLILPILLSLSSWFRTWKFLQVEILALRHQFTALERAQQSRARLTSTARLLWVTNNPETINPRFAGREVLDARS